MIAKGYIIESSILSIITVAFIVLYSIQLTMPFQNAYFTLAKKLGLVGAISLLLSVIDGSAIFFCPIWLPKYFRIFTAFFVLSELLIYVYYQLELTYLSVRKQVPRHFKITMYITMVSALIIYIFANVSQDITNKYYFNAFGNGASTFVGTILIYLVSCGYIKLKVALSTTTESTGIKKALKKLLLVMIILDAIGILSDYLQLSRGFETLKDKNAIPYRGTPEIYIGFETSMVSIIFILINGILIILLWTKKQVKTKMISFAPSIYTNKKISSLSFEHEKSMDNDHMLELPSMPKITDLS
jgi:hypothetical protein